MTTASTCGLSALDMLGSAVLLLDSGGVIRFANAAAEDLFALSRRQLLDATVCRLFDNGGELAQSVEEAARNVFAHKHQ